MSALLTLQKPIQTRTYKSWLAADGTALVYMCWGQSNALAYGDTADLVGRPELSGPLAGINIWVDASNEFHPMEAGVNIISNLDFGPELSAVYGIKQKLIAAGIDKEIYVIKTGAGGTGLVQDDTENTFHPDEPLEYFYALSGIIRRAYNVLKDGGKIPFCAGFFWIQGPHDCSSLDKANAYLHATRYLYNSLMRITRVQGVNLPPIQWGDSRFDAKVSYLYAATVLAAKDTYAAENPHAYTVEEAGLSFFDADHLDSQGVLDLGDQFAAGYSLANLPENQTGWVGVPSAPTGLTSGTITANTVALTWTLNAPAEGVTQYRIRTYGYTNPDNYNDGTEQPFTAVHYTPGTLISVSIFAVNSFGVSAESASISFTTPS